MEAEVAEESAGLPLMLKRAVAVRVEGLVILTLLSWKWM